MEKLLFITILFLSVFGNSCVQRDSIDDRRQLLALEEEWFQHEFTADTVSISSLLEDSFLCISPDSIFTRKSILEHIVANRAYRREKNIIIDSLKIEKPVIHFYDNTAVVIFTDHTYAHIGQKPVDSQTTFYDVWISTHGTWKAVSSQAHY